VLTLEKDLMKPEQDSKNHQVKLNSFDAYYLYARTCFARWVTKSADLFLKIPGSPGRLSKCVTAWAGFACAWKKDESSLPSGRVSPARKQLYQSDRQEDIFF
jgi:hypothetical protein